MATAERNSPLIFAARCSGLGGSGAGASQTPGGALPACFCAGAGQLRGALPSYQEAPPILPIPRGPLRTRSTCLHARALPAWRHVGMRHRGYQPARQGDLRTQPEAAVSQLEGPTFGAHAHAESFRVSEASAPQRPGGGSWGPLGAQLGPVSASSFRGSGGPVNACSFGIPSRARASVAGGARRRISRAHGLSGVPVQLGVSQRGRGRTSPVVDC